MTSPWRGGGDEKFKTFLDGGGGLSGIPTSLISFLSQLSFSFVFKASLGIHANESKAEGSSSLRLSHRERCFGCPSTQNLYLLLFLLPIACLNFEQTIAGISISIHFRTVGANSNNFKTHPVCYLLSTNEINPTENIFNNNVMQKGISRIVKCGRFNQFLLKSGRLQPQYIHHAGGRIQGRGRGPATIYTSRRG